MKVAPKELLAAVTKSTMDSLSGIERLHVCKFADDAASAKGEGAELLAITSIANDKEGDGFRYLIALRRGVEVTPHLSCFFPRR